MFSSFFKKKPPSLAEQLKTLAECGFRLLPDATPELLASQWDPAEFEADPYKLGLAAVGAEEPKLSENVWHFDTECIEDHGSYVAIAERFRDIACGDLPLANIRDYVDIEQGQAWVSFDLDGREVRWDCLVEDDWVDASVLSRFAQLLASRKTGRRFVYLDLGGQDCVLACLSDDELARGCEKTGLALQWLT